MYSGDRWNSMETNVVHRKSDDSDQPCTMDYNGLWWTTGGPQHSGFFGPATEGH